MPSPTMDTSPGLGKCQHTSISARESDAHGLPHTTSFPTLLAEQPQLFLLLTLLAIAAQKQITKLQCIMTGKIRRTDDGTSGLVFPPAGENGSCTIAWITLNGRDMIGLTWPAGSSGEVGALVVRGEERSNGGDGEGNGNTEEPRALSILEPEVGRRGEDDRDRTDWGGDGDGGWRWKAAMGSSAYGRPMAAVEVNE
ncbi:hypothetical protein NUW54_g8913 [Trametes sanguinea]|uniref:Uncharacterized protein n=1 Tax=Trametes sanguinea TaxID=158606 RepID=A0ACC1PBF1_9APHY|nr:hypothetical protein NUW54_g8913 [Trametes sanguinea]